MASVIVLGTVSEDERTARIVAALQLRATMLNREARSLAGQELAQARESLAGEAQACIVLADEMTGGA